MIDENIKDLKRLFGNYELDLPCTDSLNILSTTISMLEELKDLRKCVKSSAFKDGYQQGKADAIDECIETLKNSIPYTDQEDIIYGFSCAIDRLERLLEDEQS